MNATSVSDMRCHVSGTDTIPVAHLIEDQISFIGQVLIFCENKHVLSYLKNPGYTNFESSSVTDYYETLLTNYPKFFEKVEDEVFEEFTNVINFLQLEYWNGASFAIRSLAETLVYNNYGVRAWFGNAALKSKTEKEKIDLVYENIKNLGFDTFMTIVISETVKRNLLEKSDDYAKSRYKLTDSRLDLARKAAENLSTLRVARLGLEKSTLQHMKDSFALLSPIVHSRGIVDVSNINTSLENILNAYEEFYENDNRWGVIYEL